MIFQWCPGGARVEGTKPGESKNYCPWGLVNKLTDQSKQLKVDTRLANC